MATQIELLEDRDAGEEYLTANAKKTDEAVLDWKLKEMQQKKREILRRHAEVEADRKAAEDSGCAVTLRSNNTSCSDKDKSNERPGEEETKGRGRGQAWGRRRPRGPRTRPHGHFAQGSQRDNGAAELLHSNDSDRFVATGFDQSTDQVSSLCDFDASRPPEGSHLLPHSSSQPQYGGQESGEGHRGQRSAGGRGHSRPKYVTVPDASRSNDVRHVEQVNNSIVINIDRSAKPAPEPVRRGRGGRGGERGTGSRGDYFVGTLDDDAADRDFGVAAPNRSGYRGQGGRRSFRGQGDGSYRGQGRGDGGYRRPRGDGPRPFRSGYRGDRARGGRGARRAVIHVSTASSGNAVGDASVQGEEDWDRDVSTDAGDRATFAGEGEHAWVGGEGNGAATHHEEGENPGETEDGGAGHFFDSSPASGVDDHEDGVDAVSRTHKSQVSGIDVGEKTECAVERKEIERNIETAESKQQLATGAEGCDSEAGSKASAAGFEGAKPGESAEREQNSAESAKAGVKADTVEAPRSREICTDNRVIGKASEDAPDETADASKKTDPEKSPVKFADATVPNSSTASNSNELKTASPAEAEISASSVPNTVASDKNSPVFLSDASSEIPTASADKTT